MIALFRIFIMASACFLLYFWAVECAVIQSGSDGSLSDNGDDGVVQIVNQTVDIRIKQKISRQDCCPYNCGVNFDCGITRETTTTGKKTTTKAKKTTTAKAKKTTTAKGKKTTAEDSRTSTEEDE